MPTGLWVVEFGSFTTKQGGRFVAFDRQTLVAYNAPMHTCVPCFMNMYMYVFYENVYVCMCCFMVSLLEQRQKNSNPWKWPAGDCKGRGIMGGGGGGMLAGHDSGKTGAFDTRCYLQHEKKFIMKTRAAEVQRILRTPCEHILVHSFFFLLRYCIHFIYFFDDER